MVFIRHLGEALVGLGVISNRFGVLLRNMSDGYMGSAVTKGAMN